jgi:glucose-6-phosphate isomerase
MIEKFKNSKYIFFVGIGGSDLASRAVWQAMTLHQEVPQKVFFLESPDAREYAEVTEFVNNQIADLSEVVLLTVSKSGATTETLATFHQTFDLLSEKFGEPVTERVIVISTPQTLLWQLAETKGFLKLAWEGDVGGRFSAFTSAHTTFFDIVGLDVDQFLAGERLVDQAEVTHLAKNIFESYQRQINILDFFIFNSELEDLGKWCRQLIAESLAILTPTVSLGPVDLHSMLELYLGGPKNRFTIFVRSLAEIEGGVNEEAYQNVTQAYTKAELPFIKYEFAKIDEQELGQFMGFMIAVVKELGRLLDIDVYDQPAVEAYKSALKSEENL